VKNKDDSNKGHDKSIRKKLTRTVLIPSITLLVLWTVVSLYFVFNGIYARLVAVSVRQVSIPAVTALSAIQQERRVGIEYLGNAGVPLPDLQLRQQETDRKLNELDRVFGPAIDSAPAEIASRMKELKADLDQLPVLRSQVNFRSISKAQVNNFYDGLLDTAAHLFDTQARIVPDATAVQGAIAASEVFRSTDTMSREVSLVTGAFAAGEFSPDDYLQFAQLVGAYRSELARTAPFLEPEVRDQYQALIASDSWKRLVAAEDALVKRGPWTSRDKAAVPVSQAEWQSVTNQVSAGLADLTIGQADKISAATISSGNSQLRNAILGSVLALLVSVASIIIAVRVSRTLVDRTLMTRLERLRKDSLDLAGSRLPDIVERLKNGEAVDVNVELPRLDHGKDEIGQVAEAFNVAQLTAVSAAVSEAKARSGVHNVFLGIAHRNQVLVHRQLQILDEMERREEDSTQLASLFQLDHLATRARRTTENLIILGGKQPGRRWRKPVPLMEVLRAAVSETEQYSRVQVEAIPEVSLAGSAVADTIHLIAELVDNASSFSPPGSQVQVTGILVARGVVVDVSDQGLGMKDAVREWANAMMADPPEFDAMALRADSSLGLFVVARLASRLGVTVTFDPSRYGGTRATILIPIHILATDDQADHENDELWNAQEFVVNGSRGADESGVAEPEANGGELVGGSWQLQEISSGSMEKKTTMNGDTSSTRDVERTRPAPVSAQATRTERPQSTVDNGTGRAALPQRQPQESLVSQLRDDPDEDGVRGSDRSGDGTARTLSAFHRGTRRGRGSDGTTES
jgi:signal transduction histidine kinase